VAFGVGAVALLLLCYGFALRVRHAAWGHAPGNRWMRPSREPLGALAPECRWSVIGQELTLASGVCFQASLSSSWASFGTAE